MSFWKIVGRDLKNLFANPAWLFYGLVFPVLLVLVMGYVMKGEDSEAFQARDYYGVTLFLFSILNGASIAANSFLEEGIKRGNLRLLYSPVPKIWVYLSKIAASLVFGAVCHLAVFLFFREALDVEFGTKLWLLALLFLAGEAFAASLGVMVCCLVRSEGLANQILSLLLQVLSLVGGVFLSLDRFGDFWERLSRLSPMNWLVRSCFLAIYDQKTLPVLGASAGLLLLALACVFLCGRAWKEEAFL